MKNNIFFKLFLILIIALLFRLWCFDKPEGLWFDEYTSWFISSQKNFADFFSEMYKNCHTPLYYFYLKLWMLLFHDSDVSLRLSSIFASMLGVLCMYFAGKEFKNSCFGLFTAFLTAISSFSIYFAQEVRLYSLLFFFSSLTLLYFIKLTKLQSKSNFLLYFLFNALICAVHTLGIVFSFFNIIVLFLYLYKFSENYKNRLDDVLKLFKYISPFVIIIILIFPFLFTIVFSNSLSQFWSYFSFSKILYTFTDYFSPVQINIINSPESVITYIFGKKFNYVFFIFAIIPFSAGIFAVINAVMKKNNALNYSLISAGFFYVSLIIFSISGKIILITKYSCEIYPILLLALSFGLYSIEKKTFKVIIISIFTGLNLFYLLFSNQSAPKLTRPEGHLAVVKLLENSRLKSSDYVVLTYYGVEKFEKYLKSKNQYKFSSINKSNFNTVMFDNYDYLGTIKYGKSLYKDYFKEFPNKIILNYAHDNFIDKMKKGERAGLVFLNSVSFISNDRIQEIISDEQRYKKTSFIFLTFSALRNSLLYSFKDNYKIDTITMAGNWTLIVYEKIN